MWCSSGFATCWFFVIAMSYWYIIIGAKLYHLSTWANCALSVPGFLPHSQDILNFNGLRSQHIVCATLLIHQVTEFSCSSTLRRCISFYFFSRILVFLMYLAEYGFHVYRKWKSFLRERKNDVIVSNKYCVSAKLEIHNRTCKTLPASKVRRNKRKIVGLQKNCNGWI